MAAFLNDAALYLTFAALPFRALELGAGPVGLGVLPTLYAVAYMGSAARSGHFSDRFSRLALARIGCILFAVASLALAAAPSLATVYVAIPGLGIALGLFWSPIQAALSDRVPRRDLPRAVAAFNVAWSLGKGSGLLLGGIVAEAFAPRTVFLIAAAPVLVTAIVLGGSGRPAAASAAAAAAPPPEGFPELPASRVRLAWMANALAFGLVGTMNVHAPRLLLAEGAGPSAFGVLLGAVFAMQTLTFVGLSRWRPPNEAPAVALALGLGAVAVFLAAPSPAYRVLAAIPFGLATGIAYDASLHASLGRAEGRGRAAGLHEMILGAGSSLIPLLAGVASRATGSLRAPFLLAGAVLAVGVVVAVTASRRRPGRG